MVAAADVRVVPGNEIVLTPAQREQTIAIICQAFAAKLSPYGIAQRAMCAILRDSMDPAYGCYALQDEVIVGVLGQATHHGQFMRFGWWTLLRNLSPLRALLGGLVMCIEDPLAQGELRIEPLAVAQACRSHGIGSMLLHHVIVSAPGQGVTLIALDVVDSNDAAERLYRRFGFVRVRTAHTGWFTRRAGFSAIHRMHRHMDLQYPSGLELKEV